MSLADDSLLQALRRLLRPVVRLLIQKNVTLQVLTDTLKELYVVVAEETLEKDLSKATDSHISLITGVHRKDVKKYRGIKSEDEVADAPVTMGAELIARWTAQKQYLDAAGEPLALPYGNKDNAERSFSALALEVSKGNIRPNVLLEEFLRLGIVDHDQINDLITLKKEAYVPTQNQVERMHYFGANNADHLEASVRNIMSDKAVFFDRSVYHDELTKESVEVLRATATTQAMKMLKNINQKAFELSGKDKGKKDARFRINLGAYFFTDVDD